MKCALPDKPVVCFTGDGGFYYHIAELESAKRHNINVVVVVNNNSALNQEINLTHAAYGGKPRGRGEEMWRFPDDEFREESRRSFGCVGMRVEKPGELNDTLKRAIRHEQAGGGRCGDRHVRHRQEALGPELNESRDE